MSPPSQRATGSVDPDEIFDPLEFLHYLASVMEPNHGNSSIGKCKNRIKKAIEEFQDMQANLAIVTEERDSLGLKFGIAEETGGKLREEVAHLENQKLELQEEIKSIKLLKFDELILCSKQRLAALTQPSQMCPRSNTSVASSSNIVTEPKHVVVVEPKENWKPADGKQTLNYVNNALIESNKSNSGCKLKIMGKRILARNRVALQCESEHEVEKVRNTFTHDSNVTTTRPKKKLPRVIILGIPRHLSDNESTLKEDIINEIYDNDPIRAVKQDNPDEKLEVKFVKNDRVGTQYAIIECTAKLFEAMTHQGRLYIGTNYCTVKERISVVQCYSCQRYGHFSTNCQTIACANCAGNHETKQCTNQDLTKCVNCDWHNKHAKSKIDTNHKANDYNQCPQYARMEGNVRNTIQYHS